MTDQDSSSRQGLLSRQYILKRWERTSPHRSGLNPSQFPFLYLLLLPLVVSGAWLVVFQAHEVWAWDQSRTGACFPTGGLHSGPWFLLYKWSINPQLIRLSERWGGERPCEWSMNSGPVRERSVRTFSHRHFGLPFWALFLYSNY